MDIWWDKGGANEATMCLDRQGGVGGWTVLVCAWSYALGGVGPMVMDKGRAKEATACWNREGGGRLSVRLVVCAWWGGTAPT